MTPESMSVEVSSNSRFSAQLPRNLAANIAYFFVNVAIGVLLVPFFVSTLGIAAYGLIPLATSITGYVAIVVQSFDIAVARFLTIDLQQENYATANRTFNTALFGFSGITILMIPFVIMIAFHVPSIFNVPTGQEVNATLLFLGVCTAFILRFWSGNFTVQLFAFNRLDLQNLVNITNILVQTILIVLLFTILGPNLAFVGGAYLVGAVVASAVSFVLARRVCPYLRVSLSCFDRKRMKDICGMGGWVVIDQTGHLLLFEIALIVVNMLFGATMAGEYAIAVQWTILLQAIAALLAGVLVPTILTYYALEQTENIKKLTMSGVKLMGLALALPTGLICGFAPQLLTLWVGAEHENLAPLMVLLTAHLAVNMSVLPLFSVNVAHNRVMIPGIMTILLGTANLIMAIIIPLVTGWGYYGVALVGVLILTFRHTLFVPWYASRILDMQMATFLKSLVPGAFSVLLIGGASTVINTIKPLNSLFTLIMAGIIIMLVYVIMVVRFGLNPFERKILRSYLPQHWKDALGRFSFITKI